MIARLLFSALLPTLALAAPPQGEAPPATLETRATDAWTEVQNLEEQVTDLRVERANVEAEIDAVKEAIRWTAHPMKARLRDDLRALRDERRLLTDHLQAATLAVAAATAEAEAADTRLELARTDDTSDGPSPARLRRSLDERTSTAAALSARYEAARDDLQPLPQD